MIKGDGPRVIARGVKKNVATITKRRALVIARTEVIGAHAEGQLVSFEKLVVKELGLMAKECNHDKGFILLPRHQSERLNISASATGSIQYADEYSSILIVLSNDLISL